MPAGPNRTKSVVSIDNLLAALAAIGISPGGGSGGGGASLTGLGRWNYRTSVGAPASGEITFDNADPSLATVINVNDIRNDTEDMSAFLSQIDDDTFLYIQQPEDPDKNITIQVANAVDNTSYWTYDILTIVVGSTPLADDETVSFVAGANIETGAEIVEKIDIELGNNSWQGASNSVKVSDFSDPNSAVLAPYLNGGTGRWEFPDNFTLFVDSDFQTLGSVLGREIYALGNLTITPTAPLVKSIALTPALPAASNGVSSDAGGVVTINDVSLFSDDNARGFFNITGGTSLVIKTEINLIANPGLCDGNLIFEGGLGLVQTPFEIGDNVQDIDTDGFEAFGGFIGSSNDLFEFTTNTTGFNKFISGPNMKASLSAPYAVFRIESDNGYVSGNFPGCVFDENATGDFIRAVSDAAFNANPDKSLNFEFDVKGFSITQRLAEVYLSGNDVTLFSASNTPVDISGNFVLGGDTSGFSMPSEGVVQYDLSEDITYDIEFKITGYKITGGERDYQISAYFKPALGSFNPVQKTDGIDNIFIEDSVTGTPNDFVSMTYTFTQRFTTPGDQLKNMIEILANTDSWTTTKIFWTIKKVG